MNSVKRQFGIILKLAVMLCLIGCFFIGKASVVKADLQFTISDDYTKLTITTDDISSDAGSYELYLVTDSTPTIGSFKLTSSKTTATVTLDGSMVLEAAKEGDYFGNTIDFYAKGPVADSSSSDSVYAKPIYKVRALDGGSSASATVSGDYRNSSQKAVYGYSGMKVELIASGFATTVFDKWEGSNRNLDNPKLRGDEWVLDYQISDEDSMAGYIEWQLSDKDAVSDIELEPRAGGTTVHKGGTINLVSGTNKNEYEASIMPDDAEYSEENIIWDTSKTPEQIRINAKGSDFSVVYCPPNYYGSFEVTATVKGAGPKGDFNATYTLQRTATIDSVKIKQTPESNIYNGSTVMYSVASASPSVGAITKYVWYKDGIKIGGNNPTLSYRVTNDDALEGSYNITLEVNDNEASDFIETQVSIVPPVTKINSISPDGVTVDCTATITATVEPAAAARHFVSGGLGKVESSDTSCFTVDSVSADPTSGKLTIKVTGKKHDTTKKLQFSYNNKSFTKEFDFKVYIKPKLEESSSSLKITLPDKVVIGSNSTEVTGFRLYAYKSDIDSPIYDSGDTYKSAGKTKTISASDVNQIIKDKSGNFSGEQDTVKFVVVPMGHKNGSSDYSVAKTSDDKLFKSDEVLVNVYRASVSGNGIIGSSAYGIAGQKVTISAYPASGYASVKWSDGSTSNTKDVTLSTSTSANQLKAEGVLGAQNPNAAGGTGGANSGDMSGYDDVPKTAESNSAIWLIVFMVFAVLGIAYALYLQLRASTSNDK